MAFDWSVQIFYRNEDRQVALFRNESQNVQSHKNDESHLHRIWFSNNQKDFEICPLEKGFKIVLKFFEGLSQN